MDAGEGEDEVGEGVIEHGKSKRVGPHREVTCLCGETGKRDDRFDAYYCPVSGVWLEKKCQGEYCEFCEHRPDVRPL